MHPLKELARGSKAYWRGVVWLKEHPFYILLLLVPSFLGLIGVVGAGLLFLKYHSALLSFFLFEPGQSWWWVILYYAALLLFHVTALIAILLVGLIVSNVIASPLYERISQAIEDDMFPGIRVELSFWQSFRGVPEEFKKMVLIGILSLALFLVPGLNVLALLGTAFLVSWDFYDYPLARRGLSFAERLQLARSDVWAMLGMSLWFLIPFVQVILVPMAVVGGTLLSLEKLGHSAKPVTFTL
ncbi:MAG: EI24 domain-containing protein [Chitinophagaceae bacterium]|nr:EI24 domain-containing protein [Oligoflexus sp.]